MGADIPPYYGEVLEITTTLEDPQNAVPERNNERALIPPPCEGGDSKRAGTEAKEDLQRRQ